MELSREMDFFLIFSLQAPAQRLSDAEIPWGENFVRDSHRYERKDMGPCQINPHDHRCGDCPHKL